MEGEARTDFTIFPGGCYANEFLVVTFPSLSLSCQDVKYTCCKREDFFSLFVQRSERKMNVHSKEEIDFENIFRIKWPGTEVGKRKPFTRRERCIFKAV